jgi:cysteinyl-tRNA synthetase, unknown class
MKVRGAELSRFSIAMACALLAALLPTSAWAQRNRTSAASPARAEARAQAERRSRLGAMRSWGYQLRIRDLALLNAADVDLLVIDHGLAARQNNKLLFDHAEIEQLKTRPDGRRRIVLSYLSIGEAEQYRYYWQGAWCKRATAPPWVGAVNPNWPGNYPVRFWDADWQALILKPESGYITKIQAQGFDGIYLDRTDVWSEWLKERPSAERDMIAFLAKIAVAARAHDPSFLIVMQNAEELLEHRAVRRVLDGVAKEDLLHGLNFSEAPNDAATVNTALAQLRQARAGRIPVFAVEYVSDPGAIEAARKRLSGFGFVPTFAPRLLDRIGPAATTAATAAPTAATRPLAVEANTATEPRTSWGEGGPTCLID